VACLLLLNSAAVWALPWNMPEGVTEISREVYGLHMLIFWICVAIGVVVFGVMLYSIVAFRKSRGAVPAQFHENTTIEIVWTVIPFVILVSMAIPAAGTLIKMERSEGAELSIKVTGYQWKWHYQYLDEGVGFYSNLDAASNRARQIGADLKPADVEHYLLNVDHPMVVPTHTKIRLLFTSNDVIHSWWVPELAMKKDAIPGFVNELWMEIEEPGVYRGQCAELCGRDHGFMPVVVVAKPKDEFEAWLAEQRDGGGQARRAGARVAG
jgi:cytochrome c oxidase subunit 2